MSLQNAKVTALTFSNLMSSRNYNDAYAMTSTAFKNSFSVKELQLSFEDIIPSDWGEISSIEVSETMHNGQQKKQQTLLGCM